MATTTTTSGGTVTSLSNTPQAQDDIFTTGVIGTSSAAITEDLLGVVYLDVMSNDLGGNAKTLWSLDDATSLSTATKIYAPADLLVQDTGRIEATSTDTSFNGAKIWITSDGKVGYDAATLSTAFKAQLQALAGGASLTDSFTYAIRLGNGTLSWATAQVQFAGANDSVTMSLGAQAGTVTEDANATPSPTDSLSATGTIAFSDVDLSDTHTASFVAAGGNATALGNFALAAVTEAANAANGTVDWTYTLNNAAAQSLAQGQTATETYVVTINDGHGSSTTQNVTITITGTNDQVQITSGVQAGDAGEDSGDYAASGSITFTDVDLIDTHSVTVTPGASGYLGNFTTDPLSDSTGTGSGSLGWNFAVNNSALQFLGEGQIVTQTYNVAIGDGAVQTVTITITGTNDQVQISSGVQAGDAKEDSGDYAASGSITFTDADLIDTHSVTVTPGASGYLGSFTTDPLSDSTGTGSGSLGWNFAVNNAALQFLGEGQNVTQTYNVAIGDGAVQTVTITITGTNDQVQITSGVQAGDAGEDSGDYAASGSITFTDADLIDTHSVTVTPGASGYLGSFTTDPLSDSTGTGSGSLGWNFAVNNAALQLLGEGQNVTQTYNVAIGDGAVQTVTITITGTNDQVQITSGVQAGDAKEDSGDYAASGSITFTDVDLIDTHSVTVTPGASGYLGNFTTDPLSDSTGTGSGSLGWNFAVNNAALQFLGEGQNVTQTYNVAIGDGAVQTVTITITGTNDQPTLTITDTTGAMNEGNGTATLSDNGALSFADLDSTDTVTVSQTANNDIVWSGGVLNAGVASALVAGFSVDQNSWDYSSNENLDFLGAGETITFSYAVVATDDSGAANAASATQTVTITITGTNDAPVLSFATGNDAGAVQEDTTLSVSGQFSSADIDHAATATWTIAGSNTGTYGSIAVDSTGQWTYTLANGTDGVASAVQSLKVGESHDEVFSVQVSDGLGGVDTQLVTVTVTGTNDAPVLGFATGNDAGAVQEDTTLSVSGQFSSADIDHAATAAWSINGSASGTYGSIAVDSTGKWTYTLANGTDGVASAVQSLGAGESHDEVFTVQVSDGLGGVATQLMTVTVSGTNDAAVLSADIANLTETDAPLTTNGSLTISDVDSAATFVAQTNTNGSYGQFSIGTNGAWSYVADSAHNEFVAGTTYTDTFAVSSADGTLTSVTVQILGTNDAAVLSADSVNLTETNAPLITNGTLTISDVDSAATFVTQTNTAGSYGQFSIGTNGAWNYVADSAHNEFAAGTTYTDTFAVSSADGTLTSVTVQILGTNDAAVLSADIANLTETNAAVDISTTGTLTISDVDSAATFVAQTNTNGSYGQFSIGTNGAWSYVADSAHNEFVAGTTYTDTFAVSSADGTLTSVTVHILGTNDAAVLSADSANLTETNAAVDISTTGTLTISDVDSAATFVAQTNTAGSYGQFSIGTNGAWSYVADSAHNEFAAGTTYTDTFTVSSADGTLTSVTVQILGTNDAAVLSADIANLTETNAAVDISTTGTLTISDVDSAATFVAQTNTNGSYGQFSIGTNGAWSYVADSAHNEFVAGTTYTDTFAVSSADGTLTSVTVHILGTNDAAVLSADIANLTETNAAVDISTTGTLTISDVDSAATFVAQTNTNGSYGQFSIGTNGAWSYVADSAHNEFVSGTTYTDTFTVSSADGTLTSVTVQILGTNDAAVLSADSVGLTETNAPLTTSGSLTISDVDSPETFQVQSGTAGTNGTFSIDVAGNWSYTANSAFDALNVGDSLTDTFTVLSADGTATAVTVSITGSNDAAVLSSASVTLTETNAPLTTSGTLTISDVDSPETFQAQSGIAGTNGTFAIDAAGNWSYIANSAFDALNVGDSLTDTFTVLSADGTATSVTVTINGSNDSPTITSNGGGATASVSVAENSTVVTTMAATDADLPAQTLSYSIVGGADAAKFSIVSGTGALSFVSAPNFESPTDSGTNNVYDVIVRTSDGTLFDDQALAVSVTGVNDNSPVITSNGGGATASVNVAENTTAVTTVVATDADLPAQTLSYSILNTAGTDFSKFSISSTGVLTFNSAPDYENAQDVGGADGDNAYVVDVLVADGNGGTDTQTITVNVQNVVETPVDTVAPTVTVTGTALGSSNGSTSTVTFQFSEAVSGFNLSDVTVSASGATPRGTWSNFTQVDGDTYTATLTRTLGGSVKVDVTANSYTDLAGNAGAAGSSANLPAGVAGEPINLALNTPSTDISGPITVSISGVPSGWIFNAGTDNGDGTWTVQTSDPGALTVTTPSDFTGALVLDVNMYWSNSDGSDGSAYVFNNIEVYAPGAPIFALSADDNLTGSSGADTFVFAQPIGNNQIYSFDVTADKIDLIGFAGVTGFADLSITNDANGNALVSIGSGQSVTLKGVDAADLSEANFQFDVDPVMTNTGTLTIADGAIMPFGGSIHNSGTIELGSTGSETNLEILFRGATLTGGGQVLLSDSAQNVIFGGSADTVLTNVDNRISGAGQLGAGQMVLVNAGLILASGLNSLVLDTGTHTITNSGVLESTGEGGMTVASAVDNSGHLWVNGGDMRLLADVMGNGSATIDGDATLTFSGAANGSVAFHGEGAGTLVIAQAEAAGSLVGILGLESDDMLTFGDLAFGANTQLSYSANASGTGGLLTVDDGTHRAEVNLLGHYTVEDFQATDGGEAGTQVSYNGESSGTLVGSMAADVLSGGDGNDILAGRGGEDTLSGGAGADMFAYLNVAEGGDTILDYNFAEGDALDLSALLSANFVSGISQASDFVQLAQSGSDITVKVDADGAANGTNFADVAVLANTGTSGTDLVRTWFGEADHTLTA
ncbi:VCBS domain-containing protein [Pseudomonas cucumis]|uniref:VCBS domain-containing protein n=1 Tax=Pseudomonas cucumis TaxID=2954082 RepID=A0ABY9F4K2_9PSED|nr:VCBS domain-containing protein [Pseudomonas cucumis]WLG86308.1 VCBS domain-containing protein [Pseudomonas cucumis]